MTALQKLRSNLKMNEHRKKKFEGNVHYTVLNECNKEIYRSYSYGKEALLVGKSILG